MDDLEKRLARRLRYLRGESNLRDFAKRLGISHASLIRIERGEQNVALTTLGKFCRRLNCDIAELFRPIDKEK